MTWPRKPRQTRWWKRETMPTSIACYTCLSVILFNRGGGIPACIAGGIPACFAGIRCGGVVYPSMHWDRPPPWTATAAGGYASYWNAFLLEFVVRQYLWGSTHNSLARLPSHRDTREVGCYQKPSKYFTRSIYLQHGEILEFSQIKWCDYNVLAYVSNVIII